MYRKTGFIRTAAASAAILIAFASLASSAPLRNSDLALQAVDNAHPIFSLPAFPFPAAMAVLASPPRFDVSPQTVALPAAPPQALVVPHQKPEQQTRPVHPADVFDSVALPFKRLTALKRFSPVMKELSSQARFECSAAGCAFDEQTSDARQPQSIRDRMNLVNVAINRSIEYRRDADTYGVMDRWATPSETLARRQGDCEDFAILKMAALQSYGVELDAMSLVIIFDQKRQFYHAVLSVDVEGKKYVLDNLSDQVHLDSQLPDYVPLYSIRNGKGFLHGSRDKDKKIAAAVSLSDVAPGEGLPAVGG